MISYNVNRNRLDDIVPFLPDSGVVVIASRPGWGEEKILSDMICYYDSIGVKTDFWNLYGDGLKGMSAEILKCRLSVHDVLMKAGEKKTVDEKALFAQVSETDYSSVLLLVGIQAVQDNPFEAVEMSIIMEKIRGLDTNRERPIIVYSGLRGEVDARTPTIDDLGEIGIKDCENTVILLESLYNDPLIGPFFYIGSKLIAETTPLYRGRKQANKLDSSISHEQIFDRYYPTKDYIDYPRGRVVWDITENRAVVYIDPCILNAVDKIARAYHLKDYVVMQDDHYHCKNCTDKAMLFQDK